MQLTLLIHGRSVHKQEDRLIHASMIRLSLCLWLNCYDDTLYDIGDGLVKYKNRVVY